MKYNGKNECVTVYIVKVWYKWDLYCTCISYCVTSF